MPTTYFEISMESAGTTVYSESSGGSKSSETHLKNYLDSILTDYFNVHDYLGELWPNGLF